MKRKTVKPKRRRGNNDKAGDYRDVVKKIKGVGEFKPEVNMVLYGGPGTGKTTLAASLPKPLFIDCSEKGTDSIRDMKGVDVLRAETWEEVDLLYWYLKKGDHKYRSVIMDTVSQGQDLAIKQLLETKGKDVEAGSLGNWGSMTKQDWGIVSTMLKTFVISMRDLPMHVCFIAHDRIFGGEEDADASIIAPSVGPRLMPSVATTLNGAVSIIGNTFIRERFQRTATKKKGKRGKERRIVEYCMRIGPHAYYTTKMRKPKKIVLPDLLVDPTYSSIMALIEGED